MNIEDKKLYIYNLVVKNIDDKINNTILYYIRSNNVSSSENKNGFFINLSLLEDNHINRIYNLIKILEDNEIDEMIYDSDEISEENTEKSISESIELSEKGKRLVEYTKGLVE
jgi:hypothetical protein